MILLFAFLLFRGCCLSGPVTWQVNDNLKCGKTRLNKDILLSLQLQSIQRK
jgi:hypothetical protein